jgi:hypothetical protein
MRRIIKKEIIKDSSNYAFIHKVFNLFNSPAKLQKMFDMFDDLRSKYPYKLNINKFPLETAINKKIFFKIKPNLYVTPLSHSFRRFIFFDFEHKNNYIEVKIPGKTEKYFNVNLNTYNVGRSLTQFYGDNNHFSIKPAFYYSYVGKYHFFQNTLEYKQTDPLYIIGFISKEGLRIMDFLESIEGSNKKKIRTLQTSIGYKKNDFKDLVIKKVIERIRAVHKLGYVGTPDGKNLEILTNKILKGKPLKLKYKTDIHLGNYKICPNDQNHFEILSVLDCDDHYKPKTITDFQKTSEIELEYIHKKLITFGFNFSQKKLKSYVRNADEHLDNIIENIGARRLAKYEFDPNLTHPVLLDDQGFNFIINRIQNREGILPKKKINTLRKAVIRKNIFQLIKYSYRKHSRPSTKLFFCRELHLLINSTPCIKADGSFIDQPIKVQISNKFARNIKNINTTSTKKELSDLTKKETIYFQKLQNICKKKEYDLRFRQNANVSIIILTMNRRIVNICNRLKEISKIKNLRYELIIVLADNYQENLPKLINEIKKNKINCRIIESCINKLVLNRNLGISLIDNKSEYAIHWDDDVKIFGPAIEDMIRTLKNNTFLGAVSLPAYDEKKMLFTPRRNFLKLRNADLLISNHLGGLIIATRSKISKALPYRSFWPNYGDDDSFTSRINLFGFMNAFVLNTKSYFVHEQKSDNRITKCPGTLFNVILNEFLTYFLFRKHYNFQREYLSLIRINKYSKGEIPFKEIVFFWNNIKTNIDKFFVEKSGVSLDNLLPPFYNEYFLFTIHSIKKYLIDNKKEILAEKKSLNEIFEKNDNNPIQGILAISQSQNISSVNDTINNPQRIQSKEEMTDV